MRAGPEALVTTKRKRLNMQNIGLDLSEAMDTLELLLNRARTGDLGEEELQIGLCHAYHHLNFAWNTRHVPTSKYAKLTKRQFDRWGKYPVAIERF